MLIIYYLLLLVLSIYSYSLIDLNLTMINHPLWNWFRSQIINIGYFQRELSWWIYFTIVCLLFVFYFLIKKKSKKISLVRLAIIIGGILLISYPFLSHDFFNYMFDAKILTFYGKNPYLFKALDFPSDHWTRFMHWTHRTYPYGPTFLPLTLIPSFLGMGKFLLTFILFKLMYVAFYIFAVKSLEKINKQLALIIATHPIIIIEGLVNGHNDALALFIAIIAFGFLYSKPRNHELTLGAFPRSLCDKYPLISRFIPRTFWLRGKKKWIARLLFLFSGGIKYITLPLVLVSQKSKIINWIVVTLVCGLLLYLSFKSEIQPWYFLVFFSLIPISGNLVNRIEPLLFGLLLSYYPYIRLGGWDTIGKVSLKKEIIFFSLITNIFYLIFYYVKFNYVKKKRKS